MVTQLAQKKTLNVTFECDETVKTLVVDARRIKQVLVNLLSNAVKFTPAGGKVGLELRGVPDENQVILTVWDTGIGMRPEDTARLFQPFVQLDAGLNREHSGTGLGLALAAQFVRRHGGRIELKTAVGEGSRFEVILPWQPEKPSQVPPDASVPVPPPANLANPTTILLIEDTDSTIIPVSDYLESRGFKVIVARDGFAGIEAARRHMPDLIITDIQMPGMDGFEVTRQVRRDPDLAQTPIIALTALAMAGDRERCLEAGMSDYLSKPVRLSALLTILTQHLPKSQVEK
jgi:CheY-like chemotaxis protein/anti-sigma regulatory factor (Ser/Thr protein kinase)